MQQPSFLACGKHYSSLRQREPPERKRRQRHLLVALLSGTNFDTKREAKKEGVSPLLLLFCTDSITKTAFAPPKNMAPFSEMEEEERREGEEWRRNSFQGPYVFSPFLKRKEGSFGGSRASGAFRSWGSRKKEEGFLHPHHFLFRAEMEEKERIKGKGNENEY